MTQTLFTFRQVPTVAVMLAERGFAIADVLREAGFIDTSATTEITAPLGKVQRFLELSAARLDAPLFGLDLADRIPEGAYGVTEFVARTSPTVQHALSALCELSPLINPALDMRYIADQVGCEVRFAYAGERDALGAILNEYTVAYVAKHFAMVLGEPLALARAWFAHGRKQHHEELARRLGCHVGLQAADCGFAVASDVISRTIPSGNQALYAFLLAQARTQLANLGRHDVISLVTRAIEARISDLDLSAATVARAVELSQRTLQRQLTAAGTSYRDLLASIRRRRRAELERSNLTDAEIAQRLGFGSAKAMRRALEDSGDDPPAAGED
jgi:AraC-like DNA-binding protein